MTFVFDGSSFRKLDLPVHSWTILLSPMNWYLIPLSCRTVRDCSIFNLRIIISILSRVCKQLELICYEIKIEHLFYLRTVVSFGQHNTASPAPILELVLVEVVQVMKEDTADQLLIPTAVETN